MSRSLDALFAERVLGFTVRQQEIVTPVPNVFYGGPNDGWYMTHAARGHVLAAGGDFLTVPEFTQSLDAAWAGMEKLDIFSIEFDKPINEWECEIGYFDGPNSRTDVGYGLIPALTLVKACLLAVGVSQEDIDAAA